MSHRLGRCHVDADPAKASDLLQYHVREQEIAGFHSTETSHPPGFHVPVHCHDSASIYMVLGGSLTAISAPAWLLEVRDLVNDRFSENLSLNEIAESVGVHPAHLARSFRRCYRCTLGEYQRRIRVEYAGRQLSETHTPIANIALAAGFADQAHFSRTFRSHTGLTPARFRTAFGIC